MGGLPSRFVPSSKGFGKDSRFAVPEDGVSLEERSMEPFEVVLSRSPLEAWGLAWSASSQAAKRFQVAGVDPCSPAGRWNREQQAVGLRGICRGDELFEVNGSPGHSNMRQELVVSRTVCLLFRPGPQDVQRCPVLGQVKHSIHIENTDPEPEIKQPAQPAPEQPRRLSDLSFLSPEVDEADEDHDALSDASFYSKSSASSLSSSSQCSRNQQSSGRSCPSTDWEFQGYQCHNGQMLPPFARSVSSGPVSTSSSGRGKRRRRASTANVVPPAPIPPPQAQQMNQVPNHLPNQLPSQIAFPPTMVPVMVPVVNAPGQPFLAMAPMPPAMTPIAPVGAMVPPMVSPMGPGMSVAMPFPSDMPMAEMMDMAPQAFCAPASNQSFPVVPEIQSPQEMGPVSGLVQEGEQCSGPEKLEEQPEAPLEAPQATQETPEQPEAQETVTLKVRKKPTRRGGKRARHRPCHVAAAAMEWASSVGSAETPSFGEPGSGEEAEGEGEDETEEKEAGLESTRQKRHDPKAKDLPVVSEPRSFYPLAARLRVASAGLKPSTKNSKLDESSATLSSVKMQIKKIAEADEVELATTKEDLMRERPSQIEMIEEVEPEPASASDVSDIPKKEPGEGLAGSILDPVSTAPQRVIDLPSEQVVGRRVQITGLPKTPEFNGQWGKVEHFDFSCKRYAVQLLPAEGVPMIVKLRGENLRMPPVLSLYFKHATRKQAAWRPSLQATTS